MESVLEEDVRPHSGKNCEFERQPLSFSILGNSHNLAGLSVLHQVGKYSYIFFLCIQGCCEEQPFYRPVLGLAGSRMGSGDKPRNPFGPTFTNYLKFRFLKIIHTHICALNINEIQLHCLAFVYVKSNKLLSINVLTVL